MPVNMHTSPLEEKYPLLLLYVDENGKRSDFPRRVVFADKGRGKNLYNGAAKLISQWPAQVTSCWLTSLTVASAFVLLLLFMLLTSISFIKPAHLRCVRHTADNPPNQTVHLVKDGANWSQNELDILEFIARSFPDFNIHTTIVEISETEQQSRRRRESSLQNATVINVTTIEVPRTLNVTNVNSIFLQKLSELFLLDDLPLFDDNDLKFSRFLHSGNKALNLTAKKRVKRDPRVKKTKTYTSIMNKYTNIREEKTTFKLYFQNTALQYFWPGISHEMLLFAVRTQELWQYGGLSFYLPSGNENKTKLNADNALVNRLKTVITLTRQRFQNLNKNLVSIDGDGLHIAAKIPCHSFFGEILIKLTHDVGDLSVPEFIHSMLSIFCERGAVDSEYCNKQK